MNGITPDQQAAVDALERCGGNKTQAAKSIGMNRSSFRALIDRAEKWINADPSIQDVARSAGISDVSAIKMAWKITKDEAGNGYSILLHNPVNGDQVSVSDMVSEAITDALESNPPKYDPRPETEGSNLLVLDLADVHIGKLCVRSETGYSYDRGIAVHRMTEGTKRLLKLSSAHELGRIIVVLGNDILHIDKSNSTTTSGTPQDSEGSIFSMFGDALKAYISVIEECTKVADVDLLFVPSNHDWQMGWALAQTVAAWFKDHPNVKATTYNMSEAHRKYYRYENNLIGFTHGDGAKQADLYPLMVTEARDHISECKALQWYQHHVHHKDKRNVGMTSQLREKDLIGMTVVNSGHGDFEGENMKIEHVRSPSPPDGWHDRNGYVNRQGVECFVHDPQFGKYASFVAWF